VLWPPAPNIRFITRMLRKVADEMISNSPATRQRLAHARQPSRHTLLFSLSLCSHSKHFDVINPEPNDIGRQNGHLTFPGLRCCLAASVTVPEIDRSAERMGDGTHVNCRRRRSVWRRRDASSVSAAHRPHAVDSSTLSIGLAAWSVLAVTKPRPAPPRRSICTWRRSSRGCASLRGVSD
jgi:hypothetical protein